MPQEANRAMDMGNMNNHVVMEISVQTERLPDRCSHHSTPLLYCGGVKILQQYNKPRIHYVQYWQLDMFILQVICILAVTISCDNIQLHTKF